MCVYIYISNKEEMVRKGTVLIYFVSLVIITIFPWPSLANQKRKETSHPHLNLTHPLHPCLISYLCIIRSPCMLLCGDILGFELFCNSVPRPSSLNSNPHHTCMIVTAQHDHTVQGTTTRPFHGFPICFDEIPRFIEKDKMFQQKKPLPSQIWEGAIFVWPQICNLCLDCCCFSPYSLSFPNQPFQTKCYNYNLISPK